MSQDTPPTPLLVPELMSLIVSYLVEGFEHSSSDPQYVIRLSKQSRQISIAKYAVVCRPWQAYIEYHTFSQIHLTRYRLYDFHRIVHGERRKYVRSIHLDVLLPEYGPEVYGTYETEDDQTRNNTIFTHTLQTLFHIMHLWTRDQVRFKGISLVVKSYSPSDYKRLTIEALLDLRQYSIEPHLRGDRFCSTYLRLIPQSGFPHKPGTESERLLPTVSVITELRIDAGCGRHIWPSSCSEMAGSLPHLVWFKPHLWDCGDWQYIHIWETSRRELANSMHLWPSSIRHLELIYDDPAITRGYHAQSNIICGPYNNKDLLSINLHSKFQQLTTLTLSNVTLDHFTFFCSPCQTTGSTPPYWPRLTNLTMNFTIPTKPGRWIRPPWLLHDIQWHSPYGDLAPEPIDAIFLSASRAACNMPMLKEMHLDVFGTGSKLWFLYESRGSRNGGEALWEATPLYIPVKAVVRSWRRVGVQEGGRVAIKCREYDETLLGLACFRHLSL